MGLRRRLYAAGFVGASLAYIFVTLASTGRFDVREWIVFVIAFLAAFAAAERLLAWAADTGE